ncbi:RING finger protein 113A [Babesia microti strain RI]|uniref:RING finger protein 113A n=1 Tax=Babesia microti (strain RI) TaxID=1133968 RepID=A0A1R4AC83_BABMR|nr:RING finger protein 113A [Babesia microti strain RI]SJK86617.1 RING finger protein 113A [Babesia microti strain RI]|eukprot:XP_021338754.1 RING finger protein 113A [Babesia microti strain RI]
MFKNRHISNTFAKRSVNLSVESDAAAQILPVCEIIRPKKRRELNKNNSSSNKGVDDVVYSTNRDDDIRDTRATSTYEIDTSSEHDCRATLERNLKIGKQILAGELKDKVYRGKGAYRPAITMEESSIAASKYTGLYGPVRASTTNVRSTLRIDYQPDICKDYKETGYCGFGDTCKFLHDRSDYKSGWQIEKEWNEQQKLKQQKLNAKLERFKRGQMGEDLDSEAEECISSSDEITDDDLEDEITPAVKKMIRKCRKIELPYACLECKRFWKLEMHPVKLSCGHYFCQDCAVKSYQQYGKCNKCGFTLDGIMNEAQKLLELLN